MKRFFILAVLLITSIFVSYNGYGGDKSFPALHAGFTEKEVIERWGIPADKSRMYDEGKRRAVWIYNCEYLTPCAQDCDWYYDVPCYYLFFEDGKLTGWHDVR